MSKLPKIAQQRLGKALSGGPYSPSGSPLHPDADLLTGFVERNLAAPDREQVMSHLAMCADCREVVALSMSSAADHEMVVGLPSQPGWMQWKFLRFGAGAAMAAALVGTFLFTRVERRVEKTQVAQATPANASEIAKPNASDAVAPSPPSENAAQPTKSGPKEADVSVASPKTAKTSPTSNLAVSGKRNGELNGTASAGMAGSTNKDANAGETATMQSSAATLAKAEAGDAASRGLIRDRRSSDQIAATQQVSRNATFARQQTPGGGIRQQAMAAGSSSSGPATPANASVNVTSANPTLDAVEKRAESKPAAASPAPAPRLSAQKEQTMADAPSSRADEVRTDESAFKKKSSVAALSAKSFPTSGEGVPGAMVNPDPVFRSNEGKKSDESGSSGNAWRISNGKLQKSTAKRWKDVEPGTSVKLHAVVVSGKDIWVGGDAATLMHSENNGADWDQVKGDWTGNIVAIRFTSSDRGEIETSTLEKWATADNGATWRKLR